MKTKLLKSIVGVFVVILLTGLFVHWLGWICAPTNTDIDLRAIRSFHSIPRDTVEVMVYGSSHPWNSVDTRYLYDHYGIGAYNYSAHWQLLNTTQLFIEDSFRTQSPKVALIETYRVERLKQDCHMDGEIYYTKEIQNSKAKWNYLRKCFGWNLEDYVSYFVPLWAFHENWTDVSEKNINRNMSNIFVKSMGSKIHEEGTKKVRIKDAKDKQNELPADSLKVLDEIVDTCRKNGVHIVFFTAPYSGPFKYSDAMKEYAGNNGCDYVNFFELLDEISFDPKTDFWNGGHVNRSGANKVTDYLGKYITEKFDCTDMRSIEGNIWETNFQK